MLEVRVVAIHEDLGDQRSRFALDSLAAEQLASQPLDHVAHAALAIGVACVERQARNAALALLDTNQDVADLRSAAVRDGDPRTGAEQRLEMFERLRGVGKLQGNGAGFAGPRNGVAAQSDHQGFGHGLKSLSSHKRFLAPTWSAP